MKYSDNVDLETDEGATAYEEHLNREKKKNSFNEPASNRKYEAINRENSKETTEKVAGNILLLNKG